MMSYFRREDPYARERRDPYDEPYRRPGEDPYDKREPRDPPYRSENYHNPFNPGGLLLKCRLDISNFCK